MSSNIWILTTGNSDVQLKRSGTYRWNELSRKLPHEFGEEDNEKDLHLVPARAMGMAIGENIGDPIHEHLCFPLLDNFSQKLEQEKKDINQIIVILTDQRFIRENCEDGDPGLDSPYWKDTCTLKPTIEKYLKSKFPQSEINYVTIQPKSESESLDSWDQVPKLITKELFNSSSILGLMKDQDLNNIYVSHQAGTPAISSAIQFLSLSRFGKKVKFLVSNEYKSESTKIINTSNYLRGLKLQEAKILLKRFDYSGVLDLLKDDLLDDPNNQDEKMDNIKNLLSAAIKWNTSEFKVKSNTSKAEGFIEELKKLPKFEKTAEERLKYYWWPAYEAAYLAVVRIEQGNSVEALFHSFRSVEGLIINWIEDKYHQHITNKDDYAKKAICKTMINELEPTSLQDEVEKIFKKELELKVFRWKQLFWTIKQLEKNKNSDMEIFYEVTKDERNKIFHNILGLSEEEVFKAWKRPTKDDWQKIVLGCLNFITDEKFNSLEDASIMYQVHEEIVRELENYESTCLYT
ncbi:hypothetical protein CEP14_05500 [Cylindrospermopsis raciborskii C04]|uniref:CRISPR-associated protein n=1 Tax=Cylindrospermopsis raciborskii C07 TaxID=2014886 RepID=A0ABX4WLJ1_9CYAN|nr:hypothetical protein [Cylindrospermopsis raciborskii]PNJ96607.1 hypothetical protein CEP13_05430 [Cylindrospermopsis raciborskii C03]PNJ97575.1 hypothetical protein CEP15_09265 [Cylindrospermopsis raciborskii C07]PNJ97598.1 hypothetical protein CEP14_05500 [Cylindrospermopsis raciborskii C04]